MSEPEQHVSYVTVAPCPACGGWPESLTRTEGKDSADLTCGACGRVYPAKVEPEGEKA